MDLLPEDLPTGRVSIATPKGRSGARERELGPTIGFKPRKCVGEVSRRETRFFQVFAELFRKEGRKEGRVGLARGFSTLRNGSGT